MSLKDNFRTPVIQNLKSVVYNNSMLPTMIPIGIEVKPCSFESCKAVSIPEPVQMPELMRYGWQQQIKHKRNVTSSKLPLNVYSSQYADAYTRNKL